MLINNQFQYLYEREKFISTEKENKSETRNEG